MTELKIKKNTKYIVNENAIELLLTILKKQKFKTIGPTVRDNTIIYDELDKISDLPIGITDIHEAGSYRLKERSDKALFGYNVGPFSFKKYLFPPRLTILKTKKVDGKISIIKENESVEKLAFFGVKPCELQAILIQDKIFIEGEYVDNYYKKQRDNLFIVTTNCTESGSSCFCASTGSGPEAKKGFDISITELIDNGNHDFLIEAGSKDGLKVLKELPLSEASDENIQFAEQKIDSVSNSMGRTLDTTNLKELLLENLNHPHWDDIAKRCLSCGNCTMVCPTCFCSNIEDVTSLSGDYNERVRTWDSCFSKEYSYIHGGAIRASIRSRYRQWMTHKLASWQEQFDTLGCVGCGRCIVWCPVGIDITEETRSIQEQVTAQAEEVE